MNVSVGGRTRAYRTVTFDRKRNAVRLIDQRLLPHRFKIASFLTFEATAGAIKEMVVRGAGAIGATAAYGLAQGARAFHGTERAKFRQQIARIYKMIKKARPTAVDPVNAM